MSSEILIIGHKGMLGQELLKVFPDNTAWDREEIDITDKKQLENRISALAPQIIINAAAYNAVDKCEEDKKQFELAKKINGEAVGYLAEICSQNNIILLYYSTNYVFNGTKKDGYNENDKPNPINKYGESKLLGERKIIKRQNLKYYIIRLSKLFGQKGDNKMAKENFFDLMIKLAKNKNELKIVDDELSNFTYAPDLAEFTKNLLEKEKPFGIYHGVNEHPCTWYQGARDLFDILGKKVKLIPVGADEFKRPAERPKNAVLNNNKMPKLRDYKEALEEYLSQKIKSL